jgi:hypothetical protein
MRATRSSSSSSLPLFAFALATCTALPSRWAISGAQSSGTHLLRALYLGGGLLSDLAMTVPIVLFALLLLARRRWGLVLFLPLVLLACLLAQNGATEFRIERGVLPGPIDLREGMGHHDFLTAHLPSILFGRFFWMNLLCAVASALLLRRLHRSPIVIAWRSMAIGAFVWLVLMLGARQANAYASSLQNKDALAAPSTAFMSGLLQRGAFDGSPTSTRKLVAEFHGTEEEALAGARELGFPDVTLRRPLVTSGGQSGIGAKPIIFHVSLESMRADDIHSLNPHAPKEITPFLNEVYADDAPPKSPPKNIVAFKHAHQSGVRTSQALGAMMCGIGVLPFNLSITRDLGVLLKLRCLPDVLVDAGFRAHAFYGHDFVFDDMSTFLRAHHVTMVGRESFAANAPRGVWNAVSDAAVYEAAIGHAEKEENGPATAQYNFVLTLSHHAPYAEPADFAPTHRAEIEALCHARDLHGDNCARLKTLRYADEALRQFVKRVSESSKIADRSIVVVSGDHTVHQWAPWNGDPEPASAITQIPMFVRLPKGVVAPTDLRDRAATKPVSNADLPLLILSLIDDESVASLRADQRWHTLGGDASSVRGIDAHGNLFDVAENGDVKLRGITMEALHGQEDVQHAAPHNRPGLAFLSRLLAR